MTVPGEPYTYPATSGLPSWVAGPGPVARPGPSCGGCIDCHHALPRRRWFRFLACRWCGHSHWSHR